MRRLTYAQRMELPLPRRLLRIFAENWPLYTAEAAVAFGLGFSRSRGWI
jgi:hypothetical protein